MLTLTAKPPLIEVLRADTRNTETAIISLMEFYAPSETGQFNYLRSLKAVRKSYQGLHNLTALEYALPSEKERVGFKPNQEVIGMACPCAFERKTQVFDLSGRSFVFGRNRSAAYRIPFFFTENGTVKLYFLQYRKGLILSKDVYSGMLAVHQRYLLEQEFYGERVDVEYVDCSALGEKGPRVLRIHKSEDFEPWSDRRLRDHLGVVSAAMDEIERRELKVTRKRPFKDPTFPLFD
jgi:hypothetical protein